MSEKGINPQFYKKPENVEEFYKKPETHEELVERMRILKEIPEDTSIPKVVIKLGDPTKEHKFDLMKDNEGRIYLIALPIEKFGGHSEIVEFSQELYKKELSVIGGGYIEGKADKNEIVISRSSGDFGFVPKWKIKEILEQKFPTIKIKVDSENGELIDDPKLILGAAQEGNMEIVSLASKSALENSILSDKETFKKLFLERPELLKFALFTNKESFLDEKEIVLEVLKNKALNNKNNLLILQFTSERLKDDKEVVLEAVKRSFWVFKYISERLKDDKEFVLKAVRIDGLVLRYASERLKDDKEVVLEAVKNQGGVLDCASERLKDDKEIVLEAIKHDRYFLKYASERLRNELRSR